MRMDPLGRRLWQHTGTDIALWDVASRATGNYNWLWREKGGIMVKIMFLKYDTYRCIVHKGLSETNVVDGWSEWRRGRELHSMVSLLIVRIRPQTPPRRR